MKTLESSSLIPSMKKCVHWYLCQYLIVFRLCLLVDDKSPDIIFWASEEIQFALRGNGELAKKRTVRMSGQMELQIPSLASCFIIKNDNYCQETSRKRYIVVIEQICL